MENFFRKAKAVGIVPWHDDGDISGDEIVIPVSAQAHTKSQSRSWPVAFYLYILAWNCSCDVSICILTAQAHANCGVGRGQGIHLICGILPVNSRIKWLL